MTGSPGSGTGAISVAASDPTQQFPGRDVDVRATAPMLNAINANDATAPDRRAAGQGAEDPGRPGSLGCSPSEYAGTAGTLVIVETRHVRTGRPWRSSASRPARPRCSWSTTPTVLPALRGADHREPGQRHDPEDVTIPFLGVPSTTESALLAADGTTVTLSRHDTRQPGIPRAGELHVGRCAHRRQLAQAGCHRAGRQHRLGRNGHGQPGRPSSRAPRWRLRIPPAWPRWSSRRTRAGRRSSTGRRRSSTPPIRGR